ncbi:MAG: thiolase family protein [Planctomycetes bacterium]|nr:thiolase family protein [Planctomycetota bacterium]
MTATQEGSGPVDRPVVILAGLRTPFAAAGTALAGVEPAELARRPIEELLLREGIPAEAVEEVILGSAFSAPLEADVARSAALRAGIPAAVPAATIQRGSASGLEAIIAAEERIRTGAAQLVIAGGVDSLSALPLLFSSTARGKLLALSRADSILRKILAAVRLRPSDFLPHQAIEAVDVDSLTGLDRCESAERLAREFDIARLEQDELSLDSHHRALKAAVEGYLAEETVEVHAPPRYLAVVEDNGPRKGQSLGALSRLRSSAAGGHGTVTAGNTSPATDGAAVLLIASRAKAEELGKRPLGAIVAHASVGGDAERRGLGPVFAAVRALELSGLSLADLDRFEFHESSAAEVLACRKALASREFARRALGRDEAVGEIDPEKLNVHGGAIALGHPVGASAARQVLTLLLELRRADRVRGLVASTAGGGQGAAMVLERVE